MLSYFLSQDRIAWWCLAAMACYQKELQICLQAFAATQTVDRVAFIDYIKVISTHYDKLKFLRINKFKNDKFSLSGVAFRAAADC